MKVYILQEVTGFAYGYFDTYNSIAFLSKEVAERYIEHLKKFTDPLKYILTQDNPLVRACCYELYKLGHISHWKYIDVDEIPIFKIQEVEVYKGKYLI